MISAVSLKGWKSNGSEDNTNGNSPWQHCKLFRCNSAGILRYQRQLKISAETRMMEFVSAPLVRNSYIHLLAYHARCLLTRHTADLLMVRSIILLIMLIQQMTDLQKFNSCTITGYCTQCTNYCCWYLNNFSDTSTIAHFWLPQTLNT